MIIKLINDYKSSKNVMGFNFDIFRKIHVYYILNTYRKMKRNKIYC